MDYRAAAAGPTLLHPLVHRLPSIYKITANNCLLSVHNRYLVKPIVVLFVTVACKYCQIYETYFSYLYNRTDKLTVFHYDHFLLLDGVFHNLSLCWLVLKEIVSKEKVLCFFRFITKKKVLYLFSFIHKCNNICVILLLTNYSRDIFWVIILFFCSHNST